MTATQTPLDTARQVAPNPRRVTDLEEPSLRKAAPTPADIASAWPHQGAIDWDEAWEATGQFEANLWDTADLRPSEQKALDDYMEQALEEALSNARANLRKLALAAAEAFAADYPNVPRASTKPEASAGA